MRNNSNNSNPRDVSQSRASCYKAKIIEQVKIIGNGSDINIFFNSLSYLYQYTIDENLSILLINILISRA